MVYHPYHVVNKIIPVLFSGVNMHITHILNIQLSILTINLLVILGKTYLGISDIWHGAW